MSAARKRLFIINKKLLIILGSVIAAALIIVVIVLLVSSGKKAAEKQATMEKIISAGVINVGLRTDLRPLCWYDDTTKSFDGLEKDLADELMSRLFGGKVIVNYIKVDSETRDALLLSGDIDIALGASVQGSTTGIDYSEAFFTEGSAFLVRSGEMTSEIGINGGVVAVVQGSVEAAKYGNDKKTTHIENYLGAKNINASVRVYASYPEAIEALRKKFLTAVCASETFLKIYGKSGMLLLPERFIPCGYCVETRSSLEALVISVNEALSAMRNDGTINNLLKKWNDLTPYTGQ